MFSAQLPAPILFHPLKHHLGYIKAFVAQSPTTSETELKAALQTIGSSQLDLYMGPLPPGQIAQEVLQYLNERCLEHPVRYQEHLLATGTAYRSSRSPTNPTGCCAGAWWRRGMCTCILPATQHTPCA